MLNFSCVLTFLALAGAPENANPLLTELVEKGITASDGTRLKLPRPALPDGADAKTQRAAIETVAGTSHTVDDLLRDSVVAPIVLKIHTDATASADAPVRAVDLFFIAHGRWDVLLSKGFRDSLDRGQEPGKGGSQVVRFGLLDAAALARRKIEPAGKPGQEVRYGYATFNLLDKVEVSATSYSMVTKDANMLLAAGRIDPRFQADAEYPNQWRSLRWDPNDSGSVIRGPPHAYQACAFYTKVTRLDISPGAIFIEGHWVYEEPHGWFGGVNLLGSKLPLIVQTEVRSFRRKLAKASGP